MEGNRGGRTSPLRLSSEHRVTTVSQTLGCVCALWSCVHDLTDFACQQGLNGLPV